jgi:hypothetical protein
MPKITYDTSAEIYEAWTDDTNRDFIGCYDTYAEARAAVIEHVTRITKRRPVPPLVDPKSYETAKYFLDDFKLPPGSGETLTMDLAKVIQDAVEDWIIENNSIVTEETWEEHERRHGFLDDKEGN